MHMHAGSPLVANANADDGMGCLPTKLIAPALDHIWLSMVQDRLASGEDIFGPLIRKHLLHNNHRVAVEVLPDTQLAKEQEAAEQAKLTARRSSMTDADVAAAIEETQRLRLRQVRI